MSDFLDFLIGGFVGMTIYYSALRERTAAWVCLALAVTAAVAAWRM